jgi:hypothetical protein
MKNVSKVTLASWTSIFTVFWLYIPVNDTRALPRTLMAVMKSQQQLDEDGLDIQFVNIKPDKVCVSEKETQNTCLPSFQVVFHQRPKITTITKFHDQVDLIITLDDVEEFHHIGVAQLPQGLYFVAEENGAQSGGHFALHFDGTLLAH